MDLSFFLHYILQLIKFKIHFQPRNKEQEAEVLNWIFQVIGEKVPAGEYEDILKDGTVLCRLANKLIPGSVKKIQERGTNFQLMENIQRFQQAIKKYGVPQEEIFQTADLFERRNIPQVTLSLYALGRIVGTFWTSHLDLLLILFHFFSRLNSTLSSLDPVWDPKWRKRTNAPLPRNNCAPTRENSTCKWATTRVPANLDTAALATLVICKLTNKTPSDNNQTNICLKSSC